MAVADLRRELHPGSKGFDVVAVKMGLHHAGFRRPVVSEQVFGAGMTIAVKMFQTRKHLPADGVYGVNTHNALKSDIHLARNGYAEWLYNNCKIPRPHVFTVREKLRKYAFLTYVNRDSIWYTQGPDRMIGVTENIRPPQYPRLADCSAMFTWWYYVSGGPDPNGFNYNGYGFTGTMIEHGSRVTYSSRLRIGDAIFYGSDRYGNPTHVAMFMGGDMVMSHGSNAGPLYLTRRYRHDINQYRTYF